jgi:hypothetical protein
MDKLTRSKERVSELGEVFTPTHIVNEMHALIPQESWSDKTMIYLEPTCGNGQFVVKAIEEKVKAGLSPVEAVNTTFAMDIMSDNIADTRLRVLMYVHSIMSRAEFKKKEARLILILVNNIFRADSLEFIRAGKFDTVPFVVEDPTGNGQVLTHSGLEKLTVQGKKLRDAYHAWRAK